ncbi:uncharacterized protein [Symphalangus syndactylus]|uniref:uncharacterized protein n=1 Tax=Symphalangus syndactylus TaxID=9590 RepID=UPI0030072412
MGVVICTSVCIMVVPGSLPVPAPGRHWILPSPRASLKVTSPVAAMPWGIRGMKETRRQVKTGTAHASPRPPGPCASSRTGSADARQTGDGVSGTGLRVRPWSLKGGFWLRESTVMWFCGCPCQGNVRICQIPTPLAITALLLGIFSDLGFAFQKAKTTRTGSGSAGISTQNCLAPCARLPWCHEDASKTDATHVSACGLASRLGEPGLGL